MKHLFFLSLTALALTLQLRGADAPTKRIRFGEFFMVDEVANINDPSGMSWILMGEHTTNMGAADNAAQVFDAMRKCRPAYIKNGVFIYSFTYALELTPTEEKNFDPRNRERRDNKAWREAENRLVKELVDLGNTQGVPIWVLIKAKGGDSPMTFKLLTDPKLTLKK